MAGERILGPTCQATCPVQVKDGTLCCAPTGSPRPAGTKLHKSSQDQVRQRLAKLIQLRAETASMYEKLDAEIDEYFRHYAIGSMVIDMGPDILNVLRGVALKGWKILKAPVQYRDMKLGTFVRESTWARSVAHGGTRYQNTITVAEKELLKHAARESEAIVREKVIETALTADAKKFDECVRWGVPYAEIVVKSFFDIGSISFWVGVNVNRAEGKSWSESVTSDAEDIKDLAKERIDRQRDSTLERLDRRIDELTRELHR